MRAGRKSECEKIATARKVSIAQIAFRLGRKNCPNSFPEGSGSSIVYNHPSVPAQAAWIAFAAAAAAAGRQAVSGTGA